MAGPASAEVTLDGSWERPPRDLRVGDDFIIRADDGVSAGPNLFHSFQAFSLGLGEAGVFTPACTSCSGGQVSGIDRILARVTGGEISSIEGEINTRAFPGADLYLLNPSGFVFGAGAKIDVNGAFHATTADQVQFADGGGFLATAGGDASTLSVAAPVAFGFLGPPLGRIVFDHVDLLHRVDRAVFAAGGIDFEGSSLQTLAQDLVLVALGSGGVLDLTDDSWSVDDFESLGDIRLDASRVEVSTLTEPGGTLVIRGRNLTLEDGAPSPSSSNTWLGAGTRAPMDADPIGLDVKLSGTLSMRDGSRIEALPTPSLRGGDLWIEAQKVLLTGSGVSCDVKGPCTRIGMDAPAGWTAGSLSIHAAEVEVASIGAVISSQAVDRGRSGGIEIQAGHLLVRDGGQLFTLAGGPGSSAGALLLRGGEVVVSSADSRIHASADHQSSVQGITVVADRLRVTDGASLGTFALSGASTGRLAVDAGTVLIDDEGTLSTYGRMAFGSAAVLTADEWELQSGGRILSRADSGVGGELRVEGRSRISLAGSLSAIVSVATGVVVEGQVGQIQLEAPDVVVRGGFVGTPVREPGQTSGSLTIQGERVAILDGAVIDNSTTTSAAGGRIVVHATEGIRLAGADGEGLPSRILTATTGSGQGGSIEITAPRVVLDGGVVTAATSGRGVGGDVEITGDAIELRNGASVNALSEGPADAGSLRITAAESLVLSDSMISSGATSGSGGNLALYVGQVLDLQRSEISTSVAGGTGGNITIDPVFVILDDSRIIAQATTGAGGNIAITTDFLIASPDSAIDASSQSGVDGTVVLDTPDTDITGSLKPLPASFLQAAGLLRGRCAARSGAAGSLSVAGRGAGSPPDDYLPAALEVEIRDPAASLAGAGDCPDSGPGSG